MEKSKPKVSFFFGAGAEVAYGMPSGGEFALEIFRSISSKDKDQLKEQLAQVETTSNQISWFPTDLKNQRVTVFGKTNFDSVISSTLEARRQDVVTAILDFDKYAERVVNEFTKLEQSVDITRVLKELGCEPGYKTYEQEIVLNNSLTGKNLDGLFGSEYFSAYMDIIRQGGFSEGYSDNVTMLIRSLIELLIGALGKELVNTLNSNIFKKAPDDVALFDDIGGIFSLDFRRVGLDAFEHLLKEKPFNIRSQELIKNVSDNQYVAYQFLLRLFELVFSSVADYQALVDSHFSYLYQPKKEWGKFCKITTFLFTVHRYMSEQVKQCSNNQGYYEDVKGSSELDIKAMATSNYTDFISRTGCSDILHLNGELSDWYDPYKNEITNESNNVFKVPLLFTQSGTKPLTSISMSRRYIEYYDASKKSDVIIVIGYGFNADDGHINTLLRSLIDDEDKKLVVLDYNCNDVGQRKKEILRSLRCDKKSNIHVVSVDAERLVDGKSWLGAVVGKMHE